MNGRIRFGPDIEWIGPSTDHDSEIDFWKEHLVPDQSRLKEMHEAVADYLPNVQFEGLQPDYVGIRPKLVAPGGGFQDFVIRTEFSGDFVKARANGGSPIVSLLGIESPGLTASLAIAEAVVDNLVVRENYI